MEDTLIEETSSWVQSGLSMSSALRDAVCLAKVWLRQRSPDWGQREKLSGFLLTALMVHLSRPAGKLQITEQRTSLQAFRVTLEAIGYGDVLGKGIHLQQPDSNARTSDAKQFMKTSFDVVMCDPSGRLNLAHRFTKSSLHELREDAIRTLESLKDPRDGGFESVYMTPVNFASKFDYHVRLDPPSPASTTAPWCLDQERSIVYDKHVEDILTRALGQRATLVRAVERSLPSGWNPSKGLECVGAASLFVGIALNSIDVALRMADIGPDADKKEEARKFRAFWGERSELRRFKDGKISETAVWEIEPWKRHLIIGQIVNHILSRHLSLPPSAIKVTAGQLDFALLLRDKDHVSVMPKLLDAFETFSKRLRAIEDLPLKVVSVQPLSAAFRHTAVYYPQPHPLAEESTPKQRPSQVIGACLDPLEIVLQLEGSGRWPDDPVAIQKTKAAFCLKIADSMLQRWRISCVASEDAVDLLMQGFVFRISILYDKDPTHLNQERIASSLVNGKNISMKFDSVSSNQLLPPPKSDLLLRSLHASVLYGLHGIYPAYSPTVRLAKRWIASHLLSGELAEEAVELMVASLFVSPAPNAPPSSRITGFLRFLELLYRHDWSLAPLIVDVNGELTPEDVERVQAQFEKRQEGLSSGEEIMKNVSAMYIATAYDMGSETWTRSSPVGKSLKRLMAYAKSSASLLHVLIRGDADATRWQSLFRTSLDNYDAVILMHPESLPHPSRVLFPAVLHDKPVKTMDSPSDVLSLVSERVLKRGMQAARNDLLIGFDPVCSFADELKLRVGESYTIWYDTIGSDAIGLTMTNPLKLDARKVKRKKIENGQSSLESLIREIQVCGEGLVRCIHAPEKLLNKRN